MRPKHLAVSLILLNALSVGGPTPSMAQGLLEPSDDGVVFRSRILEREVSSGIPLVKTSGRYKLRISSSLARWTLKIEQLTEEEAELYTPRNSAR